jgi:hypothetical protein
MNLLQQNKTLSRAKYHVEWPLQQLKQLVRHDTQIMDDKGDG